MLHSLNKTKSEIELPYCLNEMKCMFASCCTPEVFAGELFRVYVAVFSLSFLLALYFSITMHLKVNLGSRATFFNFFMIWKNLAICYFTTTLIVLKIFETSWFTNILIVGNLKLNTRFISGMIIEHSVRAYIFGQNIFELSLLFISYVIFTLNGDYMENHKKQLFLLVSYFILLTIHLFPNEKNSTILNELNQFFNFSYIGMILINIVLINYSYNVFQTKPSVEASPEDIENKKILQKFALEIGLSEEAEDVLVGKTEKLLMMSRVQEVVYKVRKSRKKILNVGLFFIFMIAITVLFINVKNYFRNSDVLYLNYTPLLSKMDVNKLSYTMTSAVRETEKFNNKILESRLADKNYPKSLVVLMVSGITSKLFENDPNFKKVIKKICDENKDGRYYKLKSENGNLYDDWFGYFTGAGRMITGVNSNIINESLRLDSVFNRAKDKNIRNYFITSPAIAPFMKAMFPDASIINNVSNGVKYGIDHKYSKYITKHEAKNSIQLSDETRFQKLLALLRDNEIRVNKWKKLVDDQKRSKDKVTAYKGLPAGSTGILAVAHLNYIKSLNARKMDTNHPLYKEALKTIAEYIQIIYDEVSQDTIICFISDTVISNKIDPEIPVLFARKHSNFADNKMSLFSEGSLPVYESKDIASTISSLMGFGPPSCNKGKVIDEVMELADGGSDYRKLFYYKLRIQTQLLYTLLIQKMDYDIDPEEVIAQPIRPVETTTSEFYYDEMDSFHTSYLTNKLKLIKHIAPKNQIIALGIGILIVFVTILVMKNLTYADPFRIFSYYKDGSGPNINNTAFWRAFTSNIIYYLIITVAEIWYYNGNVKKPMVGTMENPRFIANYILLRIMLPGMLALNINKAYFVSCFYSNYRDDKPDFWKKHFYSIENSVFRENGLAMIYLYRLYNCLISIVVSVVLLYMYSSISVPFSKSSYLNFVVYYDRNFKSLKFITSYLIMTIVYMLIVLGDFYNYPKFTQTKQIWDSIFYLHDEKITESYGLKLNYTIEGKIFNSEFVKDIFNSDLQSEVHKKRIESGENPLIVNKVFNQDSAISAYELNAVLEDFVLGRDDDNFTKLKKSLMNPNI